MTKKSLFDEKSLTLENGEEAQLFYYCLTGQRELCREYGIAVQMEREGRWESASVEGITTSSLRIREILSKISRNLVTPCTLQEVILEELNKI